MSMTLDEAFEKAGRIAASTLHEAAGRLGALPAQIRPAFPGARLAGRALPVLTQPRSNLTVHQAIAVAAPGDILVVSTGGHHDAGYWGEIMNEAAMARKLGGLVIDGGVRDLDQLAGADFPVFSRVITMRGTDKFPGGTINRPIVIGDVVIHPGDLVVGDADGVVVLAKETVPTVLAASIAREDKERAIIEQLRAGKTTLELYNFPPA
jgi:4-hydroxy-4-methyl-2-oxoglutarate aldolase